MTTSTLLLGLLPLVIFVTVDSFAGLKAGVISAIIFSILEIAYTLIVYKQLDEISIGSLLLILLFGLISIKTNNPFYIKLQPVIMGTIIGVLFLVMQFLDKPLLLLLFKKYHLLIPSPMKENLENPFFVTILSKFSHFLGWGFLAHASAVLYSALYLSNWWWLLIRGLGLYAMMTLCMLLTRFS